MHHIKCFHSNKFWSDVLSSTVDEEEVWPEEEAAGDICRGGGAWHGRSDEGVVPSSSPTDLPHRLRWDGLVTSWIKCEQRNCKRSFCIYPGSGWKHLIILRFLTLNPPWSTVNRKWGDTFIEKKQRENQIFLLNKKRESWVLLVSGLGGRALWIFRQLKLLQSKCQMAEKSGQCWFWKLNN